MTKFDRLIAELCPNGVEFVALGEIAKISNGKDHKQLSSGTFPVYGSGGIMRKVDTFLYNKPSVLIPRKGSLGNIFFVDEPFWTVDTIFYTVINENKILPKFFYYCVVRERVEELNQAGGVPSLTKKVLDLIRIPLPPFEIQCKIVEILDNFTELTARKKQYEYYRNELLTFSNSNDAPMVTLGEIGRVAMCKRIMKAETTPDGDVPFYKIGTFGKAPDAYISAETYERYKQDYSYPQKGDVLISAAGTIGRTVIFDGEPAYYQDSNIVWLEHDGSQVLNKYLFYCYQLSPWHISTGGTIARLYNDNITKAKIPLPSLDEQARIVAILDKFDALTTDISIGLPAEIEARKKQYEYYRDKLLTFEEVSA